MKKSRSIIVKNEKGEIIAKYKNLDQAGREEGVSRETIRRAILGEKTKIKGKYFSYGETRKSRYEHRKRVVLINNNGDLKVYNTQTELAKALGVTLATVNHYIHGRCKPKYFKVYDYDYYVSMWGEPKEQEEEIQAEKEYSEEIKEEITHKTETMYYVNVLVGLANGTLVDGAIYYVGGNKLVYRREKQGLVLFGDENIGMLSRNDVLVECKVEYPLLTEKEQNFLKNLLVAFKDVKGIRKCNGVQTGTEFIRIETNTPVENVDLPTFKENQYYQSLKQNRLYSLDELGL